MARCKATTTSGTRCKNKAAKGSEYCYIPSHRQDDSLGADLTDKQQAFCEYYIQSWNASEAARKAGYSKNTCGEIGYENLRKPQIAEYIQARMDQIAMSTDEVLKRLTDWGRGSLAPFIRTDGHSEALTVSTDEAQESLGLIKKIKQRERVLKSEGDEEETILNRSFEIEIHDPKDAVDKIARIRGMYNDSLEVIGDLEIKGVNFE